MSGLFRKLFVFVVCGFVVLIVVSTKSNLAKSGKAADKSMVKDGQKAKKSLRVTAAQIVVSENIEANVETIKKAIDKAIAEKSDILLTPEGSLSGYRHIFDQGKVDEGLREIVEKASKGKLALALGTCFVEDDGKCYNQIRFYNKQGEFLGFHSKTLLTGSWDDEPKGEINHYSVRPMKTFEICGVRVGGLICNDMWANPMCTPMPDEHLSQQLSKMGAKIIFQAVNGGRNGSEWSRNVYWNFHETNLRMRAAAGRMWIVTADNCYPEDVPCSCPSGVLKPDGSWVVQAKEQGRDLVTYTIEIE
jgi:predicted amidohydrolase